jgi:hypothetical protein
LALGIHFTSTGRKTQESITALSAAGLTGRIGGSKREYAALVSRCSVQSVVSEEHDDNSGDRPPLGSIVRRLPAGTISLKFRDIKHNVPIDDAKFAVPNR